MLSELIQSLDSALSQASFLSLGAAFAWGICSMLLSPCHVAGIPLIIAYVNEQETGSSRHSAFLSSAFALGMLLMIGLIGAGTALAGCMAGDIGPAGYYVMAGIFILMGLHLLDAISLPGFRARKERVRTKGLAGALLLGALFGLASSPCTLAFLAPILTIGFHSAASNALFGAALVLFFGAGHCLVIILAGTSAELAGRVADWNRQTRMARRIRMVFGILLILGGLYFIYRAV